MSFSLEPIFANSETEKIEHSLFVHAESWSLPSGKLLTLVMSYRMADQIFPVKSKFAIMSTWFDSNPFYMVVTFVVGSGYVASFHAGARAYGTGRFYPCVLDSVSALFDYVNVMINKAWLPV